MTPRPSIIGTFAQLRVLDRFRNRAIIFGLLIAAAVAFTVYPPRYRAVVTLTPTDPQTLGLGGTLAQLGAVTSAFAGQGPIEIALRVGESADVRDSVIRKARLAERTGIADRDALHRWLEQKVDVRNLRGGIVLIETTNPDRALAKDIVAAYAEALQTRLADISRRATAYKRGLLQQLVESAATRLADAQAEYNRYRLRSRTPSPGLTTAVISARIPQLEAGIKTKEIELATARKLYTDQNVVVVQIQAEMAELRRQLAEVRRTAPSAQPNVGSAVAESATLYRLERDLATARLLYDNYVRYLEGTAVENVASTVNVRELEPAHIDSALPISWPLAAIAFACALLWAAIEFYRIRPPAGVRLAGEAAAYG